MENKGVLWAIAGAAMGYYVAYVQLEKKFRKDLKTEGEVARKFYREKYEAETKSAVESLKAAVLDVEDIRQKAAEEAIEGNWSKWSKALNETPEEVSDVVADAAIAAGNIVGNAMREEADKALTNYRGFSAGPSVQEMEQAKTEQVDAAPPEAEEEEEVVLPVPNQRNPQTLIEKDEFDLNPNEYKQFPMTYFAGDDTLSSQTDKKIEGANRTVSIGVPIDEYLRERWGGNPDGIYVRNPQQKIEYEIFWSSGTYTKEVLNEEV
jgi:hypothetical protein